MRPTKRGMVLLTSTKCDKSSESLLLLRSLGPLLDQASGLPSDKYKKYQPGSLMDKLFVHDAVVHGLDNHRYQKNGRELPRISLTLLESHCAVEDT